MNKSLSHRLQRLEAIVQYCPLMKNEQKRQSEALLESQGVTTEEVIAKHGSVGAYFHYLMSRCDGGAALPVYREMTAQEAYFDLLGKK